MAVEENLTQSELADLIVDIGLIESYGIGEIDQWVSTVAENVTSVTPDQALVDIFVDQLSSGVITKSELLLVAANSGYFDDRLGILETAGLSFIPA